MKPVLLKMRVIRQNDGHGCGYCAFASVYRYYGLDPRRLGLRRRLGTDSQSLPFVLPFRSHVEALMDRMGLDTRGTLCPDVFAVLSADRFSVASATGVYPDCKRSLRLHLGAGHPALALVAGMAHWIVVAGMDDDCVTVLDSSGYCDPSGRNRLRYRLTHEEFGSLSCGVLCVKRGRRSRVREMTGVDITREYARGAGFYLKCLGRSVPQWILNMLEG